MELAIKKYDTVPVRAIPPDTMASKVEHELYPFLQALLSLKNTDENADKIPAVMLMIEKAAYSLSFKEIKEAFVKYVNYELPGLEPKSNYLDGVLFSSVIQAYKQQRPTAKKELPQKTYTDQEKEALIFTGICNAWEEVKQSGRVDPGHTWVYDHLAELGVLKPSKEVKEKAWEKAQAELKGDAIRNTDHPKRVQMLKELEDKRNPARINLSKRIVLSEFLKSIELDELKSKL